MSGKQPPGFSFKIQFMKKRNFCQKLHDAPLEAKESTEGKRKLTTREELNEIVESDDDAAVYGYLCQTDSEGMEMLNEEEQVAFEKKYGL